MNETAKNATEPKPATEGQGFEILGEHDRVEYRLMDEQHATPAVIEALRGEPQDWRKDHPNPKDPGKPYPLKDLAERISGGNRRSISHSTLSEWLSGKYKGNNVAARLVLSWRLLLGVWRGHRMQPRSSIKRTGVTMQKSAAELRAATSDRSGSAGGQDDRSEMLAARRDARDSADGVKDAQPVLVQLWPEDLRDCWLTLPLVVPDGDSGVAGLKAELAALVGRRSMEYRQHLTAAAAAADRAEQDKSGPTEDVAAQAEPQTQ